jgi:hypothetical protein
MLLSPLQVFHGRFRRALWRDSQSADLVHERQTFLLHDGATTLQCQSGSAHFLQTATGGTGAHTTVAVVAPAHTTAAVAIASWSTCPAC